LAAKNFQMRMSKLTLYQSQVLRRCAQKQRGFNIIELLVGIAIVSMVMFYAVPSMSAWIQSSQIRNAAESVFSGLQLARTEAVRRNTSVQMVLPSVAAGATASDWVVKCVTPTDDCPGDGKAITEIQLRSSKEGSPNAQVIALPGDATIVFNGLGRMTSPVADAILNVENAAGGTCVLAGGSMRCLRIIVTTGGQARMCDPAIPVTVPPNPRGC
jgi:type IV fimbrial biogenesis protein FimT